MPDRAPIHVYAGPYVDRASELRKDAAWLARALADPATRFVAVWRSRSLVRTGDAPGAVLLARETLASIAGEAVLDTADAPAPGPILLGRRADGSACFAVELDAAREWPALSAPGAGAEFADLRLAGALLPPAEAGLLAYARALVHWRGRHRWCGACGAPTRADDAGHVMRCTREGCGTNTFPRLDPAIIVLVHDGERALLGRQAAWPPGRYSTVAGFVEPGESLEDAVAREVMEETGIAVDDVEYHSSQPWPFPSSLMIGFLARGDATRTPRVDGEELEDARWFTRDEVASGTPALPPPQSISYRLIERWYDAGGRRLAAEPHARLWALKR